MRMSNQWTVAALITAFVFVPAAALASGGGSASSPSPAPMGIEQEVKSPEELAVDHYNAGLRLRDKAWKTEEKAETLDAEKRDKQLAKAQKLFEKAATQYKLATINNPKMHQAWSSLGYALRRTGDFEKSIKAYNTALELDPNYTEAIEYRAEAFLKLGHLDEAKEAYMFLFKNDREKSDELLEAMKAWVAEHRRERGEMSQDDVEAFASWVDERSELASQTASLAGGSWGSR